jgi:hypothetical protein
MSCALALLCIGQPRPTWLGHGLTTVWLWLAVVPAVGRLPSQPLATAPDGRCYRPTNLLPHLLPHYDCATALPTSHYGMAVAATARLASHVVLSLLPAPRRAMMVSARYRRARS